MTFKDTFNGPNKTEQPYTVSSKQKIPTPITHGVGSSNDGKTQGGAPTDPSTLPMTNPSVLAEETEVETPKETEVEVDVEVKVDEAKPSKSSLYRKGATKDFVWYKDDNSKAPTEVPREQGVQASGITEFKPSQEKMEIDNPVPREMGVEASEITEFDAKEKNEVDLANPVPREEGVADSGIREFIKMNESSSYQTDLRLVLSAIKESHEI
jgi:hypothetical protein